MTVEVRVDEGLWENAMAQEAVLLRWTVQAGARIERGQPIAELLVEGARHEIVAPAAGRLADPVAADAVLEPGDLICRIVEPSAQPGAAPADALPGGFRLIHLELAREPGHPEGSLQDGYVLVLPVAEDGRIDEATAHAHADACRVTRMVGGEAGPHGLIRRASGGRWTFDYGAAAAPEAAFRLSQQRFAPGEYVSVRRGEQEHTYRVISLQPIPRGSRIAATPVE